MANRIRASIPKAADFRRRFGVGHNKHIQAVDACGVMLSSIQGLYAELLQLDREIARLRRRLSS